MPKKIKMEKPVCLICGEEKALPRFENVANRLNPAEKFRIVQCTRCGFTFLSPRPEESEMHRYYDVEEYQPHQLSDESLTDRIYKKVRNININGKIRLASKISKGNSILDIGCGTGEFLAALKNIGWQTTGMETSGEAREYAINSGLTIYPSLDNVDSKFDVITMWHVLEHVHRVDDLLKHLHRLLNDDGVLIIAVPNIDALDAAVYDQNWVALDTPRHLYHFRPVDIKKLFSQNGFAVERISNLLHFDPWYNALLSGQLSARLTTSKFGPASALKSMAVGKLSWLNGLFRPSRCASPTYLIRKV